MMTTLSQDSAASKLAEKSTGEVDSHAAWLVGSSAVFAAALVLTSRRRACRGSSRVTCDVVVAARDER